MEKPYEGLVSPPAAQATSTTATPISTALSLTATSSHSRSSGDARNDVVGTGDANVCGSACLCPAAANAAAHAGRLALEREMLYRVDLQLQGAATGGDRRKRRIIKNRESAARSRARKQAYVHELEKEVRLLRAENDALREQCEELEAAAEVPVPVKKTLQRVSSAPF